MWPSITRMGVLREFPHGDTFVLTLSSGSLNTTLFMCVRLYLCICVFVCAEEGICLKGEQTVWKRKVCLRPPALCIHIHKIFQRRDVGRSDRALLSVNLSAVYRSTFSYETPSPIIPWHFLIVFLPPLAVVDLRKASYPDMCVNGSEDRDPVCDMLNSITPRELILSKGRNPSRLPIGTTYLTTSLKLIYDKVPYF